LATSPQYWGIAETNFSHTVLLNIRYSSFIGGDMFYTIVVVTMTFAFFIFVNVAASLITSTRTSSSLASTVVFFQLIADLAFIAGLGVLGYRLLQKALRMLERNTPVAGVQNAQPRYQYEETPINPRSEGWVLIDTKPMPPITDGQVNQVQGAPVPPIQLNFPITPHPARGQAVTQIRQARERATYR
jgi:hypothetical protein